MLLHRKTYTPLREDEKRRDASPLFRGKRGFRFISAPCIALFCLLFFVSGNATAQSVTLTIRDTMAKKGDTLLVPVVVPDLSSFGIYAGQFTLSYNSGVMSIYGVQTTGTLLSGVSDVIFNTATRQLAFATSSTLSGSGALLYLKVGGLLSPGALNDSIKIINASFNEGSPAAAVDNGYFRYLTITVSPKTPAGTLVVGDSVQFSVTGDQQLPLTWSTSSSSVATISSTGKLTCVGAGQVKVLVQDARGLKDSTNLFGVFSASLRSLTVSVHDTAYTQTLVFNLPIYVTDVSSLGITAGKFTLTYNSSHLQALDVIRAGTMTASWSAPAFNITAGRIDVALAGSNELTGTGVLVYVRFRVAAAASGSTTINFSNVLFNEDINANLTSGTFTPLAAPTLVLSPSSATITRGDTLRFYVASGGRPPYTWSSSNPAIASINASSGLLTAVARGTTTVSVVDSFGFTATTGSIIVNDIRASLPDTLVGLADSLDIPIFIEDVTGVSVYAYEVRVTYNSAIVQFRKVVDVGTMSNGFTISYKDTLDTLRVAVAGSTSLAGSGTLLKLTFKAAPGAVIGNSSTLNFTVFRLNEPGSTTPTVTTTNGRIAVGNLPPGAPTAIAATNVTATGFTANWNPVASATSYRLDVSADNFTTLLSGYNDLSVSGTSQAVTGLTQLTSYSYRVRAVGTGGTSPNSNGIQVTTLPLAPSAPTANPATNVSTTGFTASWSSVANATAYRLDVSADNFVTFVAGFNDLAVAGTSQNVVGLLSSTVYSYRVRAENAGGASSSSNVIDVTTLSVGNPIPTLSAINPVKGARGDTLDLDFTGTNFLGGVTTVNLGADITINSTTVNSVTQITANITIEVSADTGSRSVSVTNVDPGGGTATLTNAFTVENPVPDITEVTPSSGQRGEVLTAAITGANFITGVTSVSFGAGITVDSITVDDLTQITAYLTISAVADTGYRTVSVTNAVPGGGTDSLANAFSVGNPAPTLFTVFPTSGGRGQTLDVVLTGTGFLASITSVSFGSGITVDSIRVDSVSQLTANITISDSAEMGPRTVLVINPGPGGGADSLVDGFHVENPLPTLTSVVPASGNVGQTLTVVLNGTNFLAGATTVDFGAEITVDSVTVDSSSHLTAKITISSFAEPGPRMVFVTNPPPGGGIAILDSAFTVISPLPTLTSISPSKGGRGETITVDVLGSNFFSGITEVSFGADIVVHSVSVLDTTQLTVTLSISDSATLGARDVVVVNAPPGGGTDTLHAAFTVENPLPVLSSVNPFVAERGQTLDVTIIGEGFLAGTTSVNFGLGITVNSLTINSFTEMVANVTVDSAASIGGRDVTVVNVPPGGGSVTLEHGFAVGNPIPSLTGISPASGTIGQTLDVTLSGANFIVGMTEVSFGEGVAVNSTSVVSAVEIKVSITIENTTTPGTRDVTVTNPVPGGGVAVLPGAFTIEGNPFPLLLSLLPTTGERGETLDVVLTGANYIDTVTTVDFGSGITINSKTVNSETQVTVNITIATGAVTGGRDVSVTNAPPGGGTASLPGGFTVVNPLPQVNTFSPLSGNRGQTLDVVITGGNFFQDATSTDFGPDITVNSHIVNSLTQLTANISISSEAATGARAMSVTNAGPGGGTLSPADSFTVTNPAPTISSVTPNRAGRGSQVNFVITGTNFFSDATSVSFGADITVNSFDVVNGTQITGNLSVGSSAALGGHSVVVTNGTPGGGTTTLPNGFTVDTSLPTGVENILETVPDVYVIKEAYPNPFNPTTTIRYGVPERSNVRIEVYNMLGNVVAVLVKGERIKGYYEVVWSADKQPSGVYLIRIHAEGVDSHKRFIASRKVVLVK